MFGTLLKLQTPIFFKFSSSVPFQNKCHIKRKFEQALAHMNIIRTGNAHSAIDDAKMLAKLMNRLNQKGARINVVTTYHYNA